MKVIGCITQEHNLWLVLVAGLICAIACFNVPAMLGRAQHAAGLVRQAWLAGAALTFGLGTWATHFVGELAFRPLLPVAYELSETLVSALIAVAGSWLSLSIYMAGPERRWNSVVAGLLTGASVGAMHFTGMQAMRLPGTIAFDPGYVAASLVVGMALAVAAFSGFGAVLGRLRNRLAASFLLVLAICGLHFTAMAAITIVPGLAPADAAHEVLLASGPLAVVVATGSLFILLLSLAGSMVDQHLAGRTAQEAQRLRQLADATFEGILIHRDGLIVDANEQFCRLVGRSRTSVIGSDVLGMVADGYVELVRERMRDPVRLATPLAHAAEIALVTGAGAEVPVEVSARPVQHDRRDAVAVVVRDLTDRKQAEERIRYLAHHDALTALPNRVLFNDRLTQALEMAGRTGGAVGVLCLDLDRFKSVNDLLGHGAGDCLLTEVGERLRASVRGLDTVARLGGDEFAVVQPLAEHPTASASLANRLIEVLSRPFAIEGQQIEIGVSIGIAIYPADGQTVPKLLKHADTALYRAKHEGRGCFRFFETGMDLRLQERRALEQELRHAVERGELQMHYQPLFGCRTTKVEGFEALMRWIHPVRGPVSPAEFIPLAEETGLIVQLGRWALETACKEAASWEGELRVAVNLSPAQFRQDDLPAMVAAILAQSGLPARRLELEVTEGVLIGDSARTLDILTELKLQGIRLSLDDFGTGYSSLSYLRRFPFDKLKIDKAFVSASEGSRQGAALVGAIVALGQSLDLDVTAEGVETQAQLDLLRAHRCQQVQGFLLGRPMPAVQARELLAQHTARCEAVAS